MGAVNIILSYALVFGVIGALVWNSSGRPNLLQQLRPTTTSSTNSASSNPNKLRRKPKRHLSEKVQEDSSTDGSPMTSGVKTQESNKGASKKRKINVGTAKAQPVSEGATVSAPSGESGMSGKDLPKQKSQTSAGNNLTPASKSRKDITGSPAGLSTGTSSTTGGDADDDMSPSTSPSLGPARAGGVDDMLPMPAPAAGVLRITGEAPAPKPVRSGNRPAETVETKKQRQARRKREEQKAMIEEAEKERLRLQQEQIRRARMASGTSNEQKANAFKASQQNAWAKPQQATASAPQHVSPMNEPLLDTFDDSPATAHAGDISSSAGTKESVSSMSSVDDSSSLLKKATNGSKSAVRTSDGEVQSAGGWMQNVPSEEEQLRRIQEQDDDSSWNTVSGKRKKSTKANGSEGSASEPTLRSGNQSKSGVAISTSRPQPQGANSFIIPGRSSETEA